MDNEPESQSTEADGQKRDKFGTRLLTNSENVFQHNAWDNVIWDEEQEAHAKKITSQHANHLLPVDKKDKLEEEAMKNWDQFYGTHQNHFFKDRNWLFTEFPELYGKQPNDLKECIPDGKEDTQNSRPSSSECGHSEDVSSDNTQAQAGSICTLIDEHPSLKLLEVGCGVGNTVFPVLKTNQNPNLMVYCCDFSSVAVDITKASPDYDQRRCHAFVHDITDEHGEVPFPPESLDIIIMIFVLSAVCPEKMQTAVNHLASYLKPGGTILFRDYGRYDMTQLRFKEGRCLSENFYVRGDGTRVYFFTQGEIKQLFETAGLTEKENIIDRRLQVNRGRQLKMYRVWIQCKYTKPTA